jgi:hypothetical protein
MSIGRGIQSAIFYYLSCAPCTKAANRRNRKRQGERDRKEREAILATEPDAYRQPSPFRTNDYWAGEIRAGPGPPARKIGKKEREKRRREKGAGVVGRGRSATRESEEESNIRVAGGIKVPEPAHLGGLRGMLKTEVHRLSGLERWRLFQREDEELWGGESVEDLAPDSWRGPFRQSVGGSSVGVPGPVTMHNRRRDGYWTAKNPPVNDMHPPVVSVPTRNKVANQWMLQPPPPSAVMNGYEHGNRNRSDSEESKVKAGKKKKVVILGEDPIIEATYDGEPGPSTMRRTISRSPKIDGTNDEHSLQKYNDSGVGSSNTSWESHDNIVRHHLFARQHQSSTRKPRRQEGPSMSHDSLPTRTTTRSKKASRVAMPTKYAEETHNKSPPRPNLSRVFSNPVPRHYNHVSLTLAELDGTAEYKQIQHHNPEDADSGEDQSASEDDLIDPLDRRAAASRQRRRRRGLTESTTNRWQPEQGRKWNFGRHNLADTVEDENENEEMRIEEEGKGEWRLERVRIPSMGGRRWSFDL